MSTAKEEVESLLDKLPDSFSIEDIQYHLYVIGKVGAWAGSRRPAGRSHPGEVEERLGEWLK